MRIFKPRGLEIVEISRQRRIEDQRKPILGAIIKGKGRTGARARFLLSRMTRAQQQPVLWGWLDGRSAEL